MDAMIRIDRHTVIPLVQVKDGGNEAHHGCPECAAYRPYPGALCAADAEQDEDCISGNFHYEVAL